jgi:MFS family permease
VGSFACIGGGLFGLDISSMAAVLTNPAWIKQFNNPDSSLQGGITAAMPGGSLLGALLVTYLGDKLGRKNTVIVSGWIWVVGSILMCASVNVAMLVVGRVIAGAAVGIASAVVPVYQSEVTAPSIRGRMVSMQQWSITWGILIQVSFITHLGYAYLFDSSVLHPIRMLLH